MKSYDMKARFYIYIYIVGIWLLVGTVRSFVPSFEYEYRYVRLKSNY